MNTQRGKWWPDQDKPREELNIWRNQWKWLRAKAIKGYLGTYLLFRPFCCDKNYIAHLEINANKLDFLRVLSPSKMSSE